MTAPGSKGGSTARSRSRTARFPSRCARPSVMASPLRAPWAASRNAVYGMPEAGGSSRRATTVHGRPGCGAPPRRAGDRRDHLVVGIGGVLFVLPPGDLVHAGGGAGVPARRLLGRRLHLDVHGRLVFEGLFQLAAEHVRGHEWERVEGAHVLQRLPRLSPVRGEQRATSSPGATRAASNVIARNVACSAALRVLPPP